MVKIHCFYKCGATELTPSAMEAHYRKYHTPLKSYYNQEFTCDNCHRYSNSNLLYSPARNKAELENKPHYCHSCVKQWRTTQPTYSPLKPKTMKKTKSKLKPKRSLKKSLKRKTGLKTQVSTLIPQPRLVKKSKNTPAYYNCLLNQAKRGFQGKITKACQECRTKAPALNANYKKEAQKLVHSYKQLGISLSKILSH